MIDAYIKMDFVTSPKPLNQGSMAGKRYRPEMGFVGDRRSTGEGRWVSALFACPCMAIQPESNPV